MRNLERFYAVTGWNRGQRAWYVVEVNALKTPLFKKKITTNHVALSDYGRIVCCGWGEHVPPQILAKLRQDPDPKKKTIFGKWTGRS
jgi:hypothetical protein